MRRGRAIRDTGHRLRPGATLGAAGSDPLPGRGAPRVLRALLEVVAVVALTLAAVVALSGSPLGVLERRFTHRPFLEYAAMIAVPLLALAARRRRAADCGITLRRARLDLDAAFTCFIPYAIAHAAGSFVRPPGPVSSAGFGAVLALATLVVVGWLLRHKPSPGGSAVSTACLLGVAAIPLLVPPTPGRAVSALTFYALFLGPGEEILFHGYAQSRLNQVFARRWDFFGAAWGWGAVLAAALFGLMHVLDLPALARGTVDLRWWRGLDTFCWGLVLGFVRERTGTVVAPALLHGLPQGIAWAFLGR